MENASPPAILPALLAWGVCNIFVASAAARLVLHLSLRCRRLDAIAWGFLCLHLLSAALLLCGATGTLRPVPILTVSLLGLATLLLHHARLRRGGEGTANARRSMRLSRPSPVALLLGLAALLVLIRLGAHVWFLPPYIWDVQTYHLASVAEWVQHGGFLRFDTPAQRSYWPAGFELFESWFALFPHHDFLVDAAGIPFLALATACVYSVARSLGIERALAVFVALIYATTPLVLLHATSCHNDLPAAAAFLWVVALATDRRQRGGPLAGPMLLAGIALCIALGSKATIAFAAPGLLVVALWAVRGPADRQPADRHGALDRRLAFALGASALWVAGFWYARNWIWFDNPFYPTDFTLFGKLVFGTGAGQGQQGAFSLGSMVESFAMLFEEKIFDSYETFNADANLMTGWGWFAFVCGLPSVAIGFLISRPLRVLSVAFVLSLASLFAWVRPDPWNLHFALWMPALFALAFGCLVQWLRPTILRHAFLTIAAACVALSFIGSLDTGRLSPEDWRRMARLDLRRRSSAELGLYIGDSYRQTLETLPAQTPLAYHVDYPGDDGWVYPLYGADLSRRLRYLPIDESTDLAAEVAARGARHLFVCRPRPIAQRKIDQALAAGTLERRGEGLYGLVD